MSTTENTTIRMALVPVPEDKWWKGKVKDLTHLPLIDWSLLSEKSTLEKDDWLGGNVDDKFLGWPWWKIKGTDIHLFVSDSLHMICVEKGEADADNVLSFILDTLSETKHIEFYSDPWPEWEEKIIYGQYTCYKNNRELEPGLVLVNVYTNNYKPKGEGTGTADYDKITDWLDKEEGTHVLSYEGTPVLEYDCQWENEYGWVKSRIGFPEKNTTTVTGLELNKKISLIKTLIQQKREEWIKLLNSLSKI